MPQSSRSLYLTGSDSFKNSEGRTSMSEIRARRNDLDVIKGIAIIGVIMYHAGLLESGYLGVDIFLVLNGFFVLPKMIHSIKESSFAYLSFLRDRLFRFLPLLGIACFFCATIGYFCMLPDDYENLSQSIIASMKELVLQD